MTDTPPTNEGTADRALGAAADRALELVADGMRIGLGTGRAAAIFIERLARRVHDGLRITAVPTSGTAERQARAARIPLVDLADGAALDLTVDGADEVAPNLDLVKGWGGALVRERIVASASRRQVIVVGPEKLVRALGERGRIPVEVVPLARGPVARRLEALGLRTTLRMPLHGAEPIRTENGNVTIDCAPPEPLSPAAARVLEGAILGLVGVVDSGLFLGTASQVLVGHPDGRVDVLERREGTP